MMGLISDFMNEDHRKLFEKFSGYMKAKGTQDEMKTLTELVLSLKKHFSLEEKVLFAAFEERTGTSSLNQPTSLLRIEHKQILELFNKIEDMLEKREDTTELEKIINEIMEKHREKEMNIVYPWLDEVMGNAEVRDIISKMKNLEKSISDTFEK